MTGDAEAVETRGAGGGRRRWKGSRGGRERRRGRWGGRGGGRRERGRRGRSGDGVGKKTYNREVIRSDVFENCGGVC